MRLVMWACDSIQPSGPLAEDQATRNRKKINLKGD